MIEYHWDNGAFVISRVVLWSVLVLAVLIDWFRFRKVKVHGWQLHRWIVAVMCLMLVKECLWAIFWQQSGHDNDDDKEAQALPLASSNSTSLPPSSDAIYFVLIFFVDLADTAFLLLLLLISVGYKITRETLPKFAWKSIIGVPVVYFITQLIIDYILVIDTGMILTSNKVKEVSSTTIHQVLLVASFINLFSLIYLWLWIFQNIRSEIRGLQVILLGQAPPRTLIDIFVGTRADPQPPTESPLNTTTNAAAHVTTADDLPSPTGESPPPYEMVSSISQQPESIVTQTLPPHMDTINLNSPNETTVNDSVATATATTLSNETPEEYNADYDIEPIGDTMKLSLLKRFNVMVSLYLAVSLGLFIWTVYMETVSGPLVVIRNLVSFIFMAGLCFSFRLRHENPYFLVASGDNFQDNNYPMENLSSTSPDTNNNNNNNTMTRDENESDEDEESHATPRTNSSGFSRLG